MRNVRNWRNLIGLRQNLEPQPQLSRFSKTDSRPKISSLRGHRRLDIFIFLPWSKQNTTKFWNLAYSARLRVSRKPSKFILPTMQSTVQPTFREHSPAKSDI